MLSIFAPIEYHARLNAIIQKEDRLSELVQVIDFLEQKPLANSHCMIVSNEAIRSTIDWFNYAPPFVLPEEILFNESNLLGLIFSKLDNLPKAEAYLKDHNPSLLLELDFVRRLQRGMPIAPEELVSEYSPFEDYRLMHNQAIVRHYAATPANFDLDKTKYFYEQALVSAPNEEYRAYSACQYAMLLLDTGDYQAAETILEEAYTYAMTEEAKAEIKRALCQLWQNQLVVPYDPSLLNKLKESLWEVLQTYEQQDRSLEIGLVLLDAGIIANYSESWAESLGYFNRALSIFETEEQEELAAMSQFHKGTLLFTWAQSGNPQFYRPAAESYQAALKLFNKSINPEVFAEIQHHLGIIYSEIPDEVKKKSIWAAVSSSAFQEALQIYTKESHPYEYASVCNHYGNALTKYPAAVLTDNYEKAIFHYQEALSIRTAVAYPIERCLTLLNYLEAHWYLGMPDDVFEEGRYREMVAMAEEVLKLSQEPDLQKEAQNHLSKLAQLKAAYA